MKLKHIMFAGLGLTMLAGATSCEDNLELVNPNQQTTESFGKTSTELDETVIACYNRIRIEGTYGRVGYLLDVVAGDEVNSYSDNDWWRPYDYMNASSNVTNDDSPIHWILRDFSYTISTCNQLLYYVDNSGMDPNSEAYKRAKGQGLFIRALSLYELACYYQTIPMSTQFGASNIQDLYKESATQDQIFDQVETDLQEAMTLLPSRDEGGEWAKGRATCGAAAGYYARALMFRHKFTDALPVLKDIIDGKYGHYELCKDYGDNFRSTVENTAESLWEIQFLDHGVGGSEMEWSPVNNSKSSTQGQALETVFCNGDFGGWNDLAATPWLYQTFKSQKTKNGTVDPRLYWTLLSYEDDYNNMDGFSNTAFTMPYTQHITTGAHKGISVAKHTAARENIYTQNPAPGLSCGVNIRLMRYSDVLLRAAECENEISGPTQQAIEWINQVRSRANLNDLKLSDFPSKDALFEQIANVERPTEFGCEHGRTQDIIRWGWLYQADRLEQLRKHASTYWVDTQASKKYNELTTAKAKELNCEVEKLPTEVTEEFKKEANQYGMSFLSVIPDNVADANDDPISNWTAGHEYLPMTQFNMQNNVNLKANSANESKSNEAFYNGYTIHPVVSGIGVQ